MILIAALVLAGCSALTEAADVSPCDRDQIGEEEGQLVGAYAVVNGKLAELCFGTPDDYLVQSWSVLTDIATPVELSPVTVFAGYRSQGSGTGNIAFAGPLGKDNQGFVVAVDLDEASKDIDELRVTMAHEFAHILTQAPNQVDFIVSRSGCETFWNGSWCFSAGSYMADWVAEFWPRASLNSLPSDGDSDARGGEERCSLDPSFLNSYAASHPEEDFAENFAAFVYSIDVPADVGARQAFFERYPELGEYRQRALAADQANLPNNFDRCG